MAKAKRSKIKAVSAERIEARRKRHLANTAALVGLPDAQRDHAIDVAEAPQIGTEPSPIKQTIRKLTRVELLARSGVLAAHEKAACEWFADVHALAFDTVGCTANYEGRSGGGFGTLDLLARYSAQARAREDYRWASGFIPEKYRPMFEAIVCRNETISGVAARAFALGRSQAENKVRLALKLCANLLHGGIAPLLPIDVPPAPRLEPVGSKAAVAEPKPMSKPISAAIDADLERLEDNGKQVDAIYIASATLRGLFLETGNRQTYRDLPLIERDGWSWGHLPAVEGTDTVTDLPS